MAPFVFLFALLSLTSHAGDTRYLYSRDTGAQKLPAKMDLVLTASKALFRDHDGESENYESLARNEGVKGTQVIYKGKGKDQVYGLSYKLEVHQDMLEGATQGKAQLKQKSKESGEAYQASYDCSRFTDPQVVAHD